MCHVSVFHGYSAHSSVIEETLQPQGKGTGLHCKFIAWDGSALFMLSLFKGSEFRLSYKSKINMHCVSYEF